MAFMWWCDGEGDYMDKVTSKQSPGWRSSTSALHSRATSGRSTIPSTIGGCARPAGSSPSGFCANRSAMAARRPSMPARGEKETMRKSCLPFSSAPAHLTFTTTGDSPSDDPASSATSAAGGRKGPREE